MEKTFKLSKICGGVKEKHFKCILTYFFYGFIFHFGGFVIALKKTLQNESLSPSLHRRMWAGRGQLWTRFVSVFLPER